MSEVKWRPGLTSHRTVAKFRGFWLRTFDGAWWVNGAANRRLAQGGGGLEGRALAERAAEEWVRQRTDVRDGTPPAPSPENGPNTQTPPR